MIYTPELVVASWNAALVFDPDHGPEHWEQGFKAVRAMGDEVQVLGITELAGPEADDSHLDMVRAGMEELGFQDSEITNGVRHDSLKVSVWTRIPCEVGRLALSGNRYLPQITVPGFGKVVVMHEPSESEPERVEIAHAFVGAVNAAAEETDAVEESVLLIGDDNATYTDDGVRARLMHTLDPLVRWIPNATEIDYHDKSKKVRWAAGALIRACAMTRGTTMKVLTDADFSDAAPSNQSEPTVFLGPFKLRVDHMMGRNVSFRDYEVLPRATDESGDPLSDHAGIKAKVTNNVKLKT